MTSPASSHAARRQSLTRDIYTPTRQERRHSGEDSMGNIPFRQGQQISATMSAFGHNYPSSHQVDHSYVILIRVHCTKMAVKDGRRTSDLSSRVSKHHAPMGTKVPGPATWHRYHHSVLASPVGQRPVPLVTRHQKSKKQNVEGCVQIPSCHPVTGQRSGYVSSGDLIDWQAATVQPSQAPYHVPVQSPTTTERGSVIVRFWHL